MKRVNNYDELMDYVSNSAFYRLEQITSGNFIGPNDGQVIPSTKLGQLYDEGKITAIFMSSKNTRLIFRMDGLDTHAVPYKVIWEK